MASTTPQPLLPWKTRVQIYFLTKASDVVRRTNGTVNRRLMNFLDFKTPPNAAAVKGVSTKDVTVNATRNLWFRCFLIGDSAGANVAHHVAVRVAKSGLREFRVGISGLQRVRVVGLVSIQAWFGGEERTEAEKRLVDAPIVSVPRTDWLWKAFLPDGSDRDHGAVNVCGPNSEDLSGLDYPETLVFVSGFDPLQDWQKRYYEWLKSMGKKVQLIEYPTMIHAFYIFPEIPESSHLISEVKDFINERINRISDLK
ncbi:hypothetical protein Fmac_015657 [Flemingia macrophylla]|uniref:Alpha/beta hydrolase fold-3 domain-containing protein n=1 Tax=Flemingia macrophylla TaxID=520843 RepID=A0ABD1MFC0_9FABA